MNIMPLNLLWGIDSKYDDITYDAIYALLIKYKVRELDIFLKEYIDKDLKDKEPVIKLTKSGRIKSNC